MTLLKLRESSCLVESRIWELARQIAAAMSYLHSKEVAHGDLKPSNILIGDNNTVRHSRPWCIVMAYIVMAYIVMAYIVMAHIVMAYVVMAYVVMAYVVMVHIGAHSRLWCGAA